MKDITFIVKTFERPYCIKRLVKSVVKKYPDARILIADDSEKTCKNYFEHSKWSKNVQVYELPHDCGLSKGRNYLVDKVETRYFVLLDDDFIFDDRTDILRALEILKVKDLDILGGYFRNYKAITINFLKYPYILLRILFKCEKPFNYLGTIEEDTANKTLTVNYIEHQFPKYTDSDIVHNFFIAKTDVVKLRNRWDEDLKLQEHTAFFYTAKKNGLKVGFSNEFSVQHRPIRVYKYRSFRKRNFIKVFMEKNDFLKIISKYDNREIKIIEYDKL